MQKEQIKQAKVVVLGPVGVGKSSLTSRFINNQFDENITTTLGAVYFQKIHSYGDGKKMKFQFWDTAGQQKFRSIAKIYYKNARAAIMMYDVSSKQTFQGLKLWLEEVKTHGPENIIIAIVGNKIDLLQHQVSVNEVQQYAKLQHALLKLVSVKQNKGVQQLFQSLANQIQQNEQKPKGKSSKINDQTVVDEKKRCC